MFPTYFTDFVHYISHTGVRITVYYYHHKSFGWEYMYQYNDKGGYIVRWKVKSFK